ncbi:MAG: purine-nucleoside phosphorylase [Bacteroidales bacterium]|nr:purine-nucleoside phosphorylase [Bacteroidales bacterium]MCF8389060.1 purine-nucleoside phosphorylase [Bacteroidales bacterium]
MLETIKETVSFIKNKANFEPEIAIILGTGLGSVVDDIKIESEIKYTDIPNFPVSTAPGHKGKLIFGYLGGKKVMALQGRFHYYEGHSMEKLTFPIRVMKFLGIKYLFISNASGGVNPDFEIGDLMIINDHINQMPNPLIGKHYDELGDRFPDMSQAYNKSLITKAEEIARAENIKVQKGCYVGVTGPTLETPKEYSYFRIIGGDAVGMSTVPEVIVAHQMGIPCFAISIITDLGVPGRIVEVSVEDVQKAASEAAPRMVTIMEKLIETLD